MGLLIKGMEMPKNCGACPLRASCIHRIYLERRPDYCPLVEVPPHGDLIDRKTAYDSLLNGMVMTGYQSRALDCISDIYVPTIIPADEGKKEGDAEQS